MSPLLEISSPFSVYFNAFKSILNLSALGVFEDSLRSIASAISSVILGESIVPSNSSSSPFISNKINCPDISVVQSCPDVIV